MKVKPPTHKKSTKTRLDIPEAPQTTDDTRKKLNVRCSQQLYAKLISKSTKDRVKLVDRCFALLGEELRIAYRKHDLCRVLQACLKYGSQTQQHKLVQRMGGEFGDILLDKYSAHLGVKLYKVAAEKAPLLADALSRARILAAHPVIYSQGGVKFLEFLFEHGKKKDVEAAILYGSPTATWTSFTEFVESGTEEAKESLKNVRKLAHKIMRKERFNYHVLQHIVAEYLPCAKPDERADLLSFCHTNMASLFTSRPGVRLAVLAVSIAESKERKEIMKNVKPHVPGMVHSQGYLFLMKLLEVVDDFQKLNSLILRVSASQEISTSIEEFVTVGSGVKVLMSLFPIERQKYLSDSEVQLLSEDLNKSSKKDPEIRQTQLRNELLPRIIWGLQQKLPEVVKENLASRLLVTVIAQCQLENYDCQSLAERVSGLFTDLEILDDPVAHRTLKRIVEIEKETKQPHFSRAILASLKKEKSRIKFILKTRSIWVCIALAEHPRLKTKAKNLFKKHVTGLNPGLKGNEVLLGLLTS